MDYSRQEILKEIGHAGQTKLKKSSAAIIGMGAVGTACSEILCRAGIGQLNIIDRDIIEQSNLQRQLLYNSSDIGLPKVQVAKQCLSKINPEAIIEAHAIDVNYRNIQTVNADIIIDCTDNLETRFLINEYCKDKTNWVYSAAIGTQGTVMGIIPKGPCIRCFLSETSELETCDTAGVLGSTTAVTGSIAATVAIKILLGKYEQKMARFDVWQQTMQQINVKKNKKCRCCNGERSYINGKKNSKAVKLCGANNYQIAIKGDLSSIKKKFNKFENLGYAIRINGITIFPDGRAMVPAASESQARAKLARITG